MYSHVYTCLAWIYLKLAWAPRKKGSDFQGTPNVEINSHPRQEKTKVEFLYCCKKLFATETWPRESTPKQTHNLGVVVGVILGLAKRLLLRQLFMDWEKCVYNDPGGLAIIRWFWCSGLFSSPQLSLTIAAKKTWWQWPWSWWSW